MSDEGPGGTPGLLRLPRTALASSAHDRPYRVALCHGPTTHGEDATASIAEDGAVNGLRARAFRAERMATAENSEMLTDVVGGVISRPASR